ncbi:response regulator transcription factor [Labrys sp. KB_33_2]|uniref:response regulator transcription factor n=1 Tax=Labrys sp. KB_33_2 TaxID=3237479 RepID=UPI003F8E5568
MRFTTQDLSFHQRFGHLLEQVESETFWPRFAAFLRESVRFDSWVVLIFRKAHSPLLVHEGDLDNVVDELFGSYLRRYFTDDPFYRFALGGFSPGIYRLDEITSPQFRSSAYFRDYFRYNVVEDELQFLMPFGKREERRGVLSLSLGSEQRFSEQDYGLLSLMSHWVLPLIGMAARSALADTQVPADRPDISSTADLEQRLRAHDGPHLTEREIQVALLLLSGQSNKGIAIHLGISPETAKVHRRNLYEKLGISSQAEIFTRFLGTGRLQA